MSKHTPGPWDIGYAQGDDIVIVGPGRELEICTVWSDPDVCDARLIAAAPDLLQALRDIVEGTRLDEFNRNDDGLIDHGRNFDRRINAARAAIAKAEGRA